MMTIRKDSPFYGITDEQIDWLQELATDHDLCDVAEDWARTSGKEVYMEQTRRFLARAKRHRMLMDAEDSAGDMEEFAGAGKGGRLRDGVIEAARQRLLEEAMEKGDSATLLELCKAANQERAQENQAEVERRKAAVAEENAKIGWTRLEILASGITKQKLLKTAVVETEVVENETTASEAEAALRLLPKLRAVLEEAGGSAEEKLARVREELGAGTRLLIEETGSTQRREDPKAQRGD